MTVRTLFTKRKLRWAAAGIASVVTTFVGLQKMPIAQTAPVSAACTLSDVADWTAALNNPYEEHTPAYLLSVTEDFIAACPGRPEQSEAHQIAGMSASAMFNFPLAVSHFEKAGPIYSADTLYTYSNALLMLDRQAQAWQVRDQIVDLWLNKLSRARGIEITETEVPGGLLIRQTKSTAGGPPVATWTALPDGPGWPASLSVGPDHQINLFRDIRSSASKTTGTAVTLNQCSGRRLLAPLDPTPSRKILDQTAKAALTAYLANPDPGEELPYGATACFSPDRLLPVLSD